jgi:ABC-2 type transport system ATP-binding protein
MDAAVVSVKGLRKSYGPVVALDGIDFEVAQGEVFALLGPNGAGKTTTVEILEGYRPRTAGEVQVLGEDPAKAGRTWRAGIGVVLQEHGFRTQLTVSELLTLFAGYYPKRRPLDELLELAGLTDNAGARVRTLSGGQQRRLELALALVGDPQVVFLDEPTTGFDPSARRRAWDVVKNLCSLGTTVLLTTHYMDEAAHLADRLAIVARGRIVAEGTPQAIADRKTRAYRITFDLPPKVSVDKLPLPASLLNGAAVIETTDPVPDLHRLTAWAMRRKIDLPGLSVNPPSLEDLYLEITGE